MVGDNCGVETDSHISLAGTYLLHALDEFRNAGSPDSLYRELEPWYSAGSILTPIQRDAQARFRRLRHLRATVLFAALAAEGYANEFLASQLTGQAFDGADRLPAIDKFVLGPRLAGLDSPIAYDSEPGQSLAALFKARHKLVHPIPRKGVFPDFYLDEGKDVFEPELAARYLIQVAHAAHLLHPLRGDNALESPAKRIWEERKVLEDHVDTIGRSVTAIPSLDDEPLRDIMILMTERAGRRKQRAASGKLGTIWAELAPQGQHERSRCASPGIRRRAPLLPRAARRVEGRRFRQRWRVSCLGCQSTATVGLSFLPAPTRSRSMPRACTAAPIGHGSERDSMIGSDSTRPGIPMPPS